MLIKPDIVKYFSVMPTRVVHSIQKSQRRINNKTTTDDDDDNNHKM